MTTLILWDANEENKIECNKDWDLYDDYVNVDFLKFQNLTVMKKVQNFYINDLQYPRYVTAKYLFVLIFLALNI